MLFVLLVGFVVPPLDWIPLPELAKLKMVGTEPWLEIFVPEGA